MASTSPTVGNSTKCASVNRFYGETRQYEPVAGGKIDVYLKRVIFGAKFVVTGLKEGTLDVKCGDFFSKTYNTDDGGDEKIYTFPNVYKVWLNDTPLTEMLPYPMRVLAANCGISVRNKKCSSKEM